MLVARRYNFACVTKRSNCTTVPRLLSMIKFTGTSAYVALVTRTDKFVFQFAYLHNVYNCSSH